MTKMKGLLLGATAGLLTVASAQAADLPIKAKPVEYVKVCSLYGAGFFYIPGTDTCLKIGGYIRSDHIYGSSGAGGYFLSGVGAFGSGANRLQTDNYNFRARINLTTDFRTQTDYGTLRAYAAIIGQQSQGDPAATGSAGILRAFIQFAGFTVGHAVSYYDFMNGADYGYLPSVWSTGTGVNGTDLIAYTWQIGNGFSASIDIEDGGNGGLATVGTGRGKILFNASNPGTVGSAAAAVVGIGGAGVVFQNDAARAMQPDIAGNLRVDQAWGSAQIMAALHNASGAYYSNFPGLLGPGAGGINPGSQVFGHPGEAWGYAVGGGAKLVNFLLPRDMIEFQANFCHGATAYCVINGLYGQNFIYGSGNRVTMGFTTDGIFTNGSQIELTNNFSYAVGYQHYWNPQWRTSLVGGQAYTWYNAAAQGMFCGTVGGASAAFFGFQAGTNTITNCNPNWSQSSLSTRTAWNPHPFLEIGLDLIWYHMNSANNGGQINLVANGARPGGTYTVANLDAYVMVLRFQKNILP